VAHLGLYGVLGGTLAWGRDAARRRVPHVLLVLIGLLYGASDEWHQSFVPGRTPSAGDLAADGIGVLAGYASTFAFLTRRGEARRPPSPRPPPTR
jgi:VanZ family protein